MVTQNISLEDKLKKRLELLVSSKKTTFLQNDYSKSWIKQNLSLIGISSNMLDICIEVLEYMGDLKVIWLHLQECTGCSESLLRTETPSFDTLVFDLFKIEYHDLIMYASGHGAISALEHAKEKQNYVLLVEGSIPMGFAKNYITLANRNGYEEISHLINKAEAVFAIGTCSSFGGIQTAYPNPTNGYALNQLFDCDIVNISGCPPSDKNIIATLLYYYLFKEIPQLDSLKRPLWAYNKSVHDLCERKSFFMSGDFVESFDDPKMKDGYCLYKVGCKGPYTYNNCPKVKFNSKTSWPVQGGHGCIGCSEPNFWDNFGNIEKPINNENFFIMNNKFLPKKIPIKQQKISIKTQKEFLEFIQQNNYTKSIFINLDINKNQIILQENNICKELMNINIEINPKLILKEYENKNKQGKRLYENYKIKFSQCFESIQNIDNTSKISTNIYDILSLFNIILNSNSKLSNIEIDSINSWLNGDINCCQLQTKFNAKNVIKLAQEFKFPYISELNFKFKNENNMLNLDINKALSTAMSYRIGGLDIQGIAYSIICDIAKIISKEIIQYECNVILQGDIFHLQQVQQIFIKNNKEVLFLI